MVRRRNSDKRALYENIMTKVGKEVRRTLNESSNDLHDYCINIATELENIVNGESEEYSSLMDYFDDMLNIEYTVDASKRLIGARIAVTLGGPNIFINTRYGKVEGYWGGQECEISLDNAVTRELEDLVDMWYGE